MQAADGIIITISAKMLKEKGYRNWLRNFLGAMATEGMTYWMRQGAKPKRDLLYVYLCIGGQIRFRANFVMAEGRGYKTFIDARGVETTMWGSAWIVLAGPVVRQPYRINAWRMKGFRGFRYCDKLF